MGFFSSLRNRFNLSEHDRQQIFKLFGWRVNNIGQGDSKTLKYGYEQSVEVYSIINKLIDSLLTGVWVVKRINSDGSVDIIEDSTLHELMRNPNKGKGYTWDDIDSQLALYLTTTGNSYMLGESGVFSSRIDEVDILPTPQMTINTNQDFFAPDIRYQFALGTQVRNFENEDIEHIKFFNPLYSSVQESFYGLSPIQVAAWTVTAANNRWEADAALLKNRGAIGLISDRSERPMKKEESDELQNDWNHDIGGPGKFGKIKVTNKDLKYIPMAMSSTDLQLIEKGVVNLRALCNVWGLDSSLFNDPANKTFNNRLQAEKALYTNAVIPLANKISQHHTMFLAKNHFPGENVQMCLEFDHIESLQRDKLEEATKDKTVVEGINVVLSMPISQEAKALILMEKYDYTEEAVRIITQQDSNGTQE